MYEGVKLVNLTPHPIVLSRPDEGFHLVVPSEDKDNPARVEETTVEVSPGYYTVKYGEVYGLPDPEEGTIYIVSAMVRSAVPHRTDVYSPASSLATRNELGHIVSVPGLVR